MTETNVKTQVRQFYDQVGWQKVSEGCYQNAQYEDLRPVSQEYIHRCHLRVGRYLKPGGRFLLDAGSGPIQYPEYLTYSQGYRYRVCADISIVALQEARQRIGEHGLFVVADVANLPFKKECFDGVVSLHTFHHLPLADQVKAYDELYRAMAPGTGAVVVNGWSDSSLMRRLGWLVRRMEKWNRGRAPNEPGEAAGISPSAVPPDQSTRPAGTYVQKMDAAWLRRTLSGKMAIDIRVWRSLSVRFLRAVIHPRLGGRLLLRLVYWLEERFPHFLGEKGQYPLVIIRK